MPITQLVLPVTLFGIGLGVLVGAMLYRVRSRTEVLSDILDLPYGEHDVPISAVTETRGALFEGSVAAATRLIGQVDSRGSLGALLEKARLPVKPAEYVLLAGAGGLAAGVLLLALTGEWLYGPAGPLLALGVAIQLPKQRIAKRRRSFEEQLPDAIGLIAGSLSAGHTFLRAIQMMCEEAAPPLSEEFARIVQEVRLGASVVDALDRMAKRLDIKDLEWIVQAIRIQQTVGGKLSDLLYSLADFIRAREDIRREVKVLTAEGRISAYMLGALPPIVLLVIQVTNPVYMKPMYQGWGIIVLAATAASVVGGIAIILRMVNIKI